MVDARAKRGKVSFFLCSPPEPLEERETPCWVIEDDEQRIPDGSDELAVSNEDPAGHLSETLNEVRSRLIAVNFRKRGEAG